MDKELNGSQIGGSSGGNSQADSSNNFVNLDAMLQQTNGGPPLPGSDNQNPTPPAGGAAANQSPAQKVKGWMPQIADDTDLIEKEWVEKAKEIVEHTSGDPYAQNEQLSELKAEYLKKRYNKIIKPSDK